MSTMFWIYKTIIYLIIFFTVYKFQFCLPNYLYYKELGFYSFSIPYPGNYCKRLFWGIIKKNTSSQRLVFSKRNKKGKAITETQLFHP